MAAPVVVVVVVFVVALLQVAFAVHLFVVVLVAFQLRVLGFVDPSQLPHVFWLHLLL